MHIIVLSFFRALQISLAYKWMESINARLWVKDQYYTMT